MTGDHGASVPSAAQIHILCHSLGLTYGREMYRNHFVTGEGSTDHPDCEALVNMGLMTKQAGGPLTGGDDAFFVTEAGKAVAIQSLPKLSRSQERYRRWLDVADVTNQPFGEWLKMPRTPSEPTP
jgi:hypothetical protein